MVGMATVDPSPFGAVPRSADWIPTFLCTQLAPNSTSSAAVAPDAIPPMLNPGDTVAGFNQLGPRVPVVVIAPFAKAHYVSHVVHDHTSISRFIETRFDLPALTARDAAANPDARVLRLRQSSFQDSTNVPGPFSHALLNAGRTLCSKSRRVDQPSSIGIPPQSGWSGANGKGAA